MSKKIGYVTKKQVSNYIKDVINIMNITKVELDELVMETLIDLKEFPNDNPNQIKFYTRVHEELLNKTNDEL